MFIESKRSAGAYISTAKCSFIVWWVLPSASLERDAAKFMVSELKRVTTGEL